MRIRFVPGKNATLSLVAWFITDGRVVVALKGGTGHRICIRFPRVGPSHMIGQGDPPPGVLLGTPVG